MFEIVIELQEIELYIKELEEEGRDDTYILEAIKHHVTTRREWADGQLPQEEFYDV